MTPMIAESWTDENDSATNNCFETISIQNVYVNQDYKNTKKNVSGQSSGLRMC